MKIIRIILITVFVILNISAVSAAPTKPSPYFVHDTEVHFFDLYNRVMDLDSPVKLAANAILTPYQYVADLFGEIPIGLQGNSLKTSVARQRSSFFTIFAGVAFQFHGDGHPDRDFGKFLTDDGYRPNNNESAIHIIGASYFSKKFMVKLGYLFGVYHLDNTVWDDASKTQVDAANYFNYKSSAMTATSGWDRLYGTPSARYHRLILETDWDIGLMVFHLLTVTNFVKPPAYTRIAPEITITKGKHIVQPYYINTNDIEGRESFYINQIGIKDKYYINRSFDPLKMIMFNFDMNYTFVKDTDVADGRREFYIMAEYIVYSIGLSAWYNIDNGVGVGLGWILDLNERGRIWIQYKYNSFVSTPVYLRNINDRRWSFEFGFNVAIF